MLGLKLNHVSKRGHRGQWVHLLQPSDTIMVVQNLANNISGNYLVPYE